MLIYPILGVLAIGVVMLALNPLFAWINTALNGFLAIRGFVIAGRRPPPFSVKVLCAA